MRELFLDFCVKIFYSGLRADTMEYTIKLSAYELAMLDAACRACGLPLVEAVKKAVDAQMSGAEKGEEAPGFSVTMEESSESRSSGNPQVSADTKEIVSVRFERK